MTDCRLCHWAAVALPLPSTRLKTPWACATSAALAPLASIMSLKPSAAFVARSRSPVESAMACVRPTTSCVADGRPSRCSMMSAMLLDAASDV